MASVTDICNLALAHLGESPSVASINPPEGGFHAEQCAIFYPVARNVCLEVREWTFATKRVALAALANTSIPGWDYAYARPSDCVKALRVLSEDQDDDLDDVNPIDFIEENGVFYTNQESAVLKYTYRVEDTTKYTALFVNALSYLLASHLAGPITKDTKIKSAMFEAYRNELGLAVDANANVGRQAAYPRHTPTWIGGRR